MGRNKIPIERIQNARNRQATFTKRKNGLFKKAIELSILCDCEIALIIMNPNQKVYQYSTANMDELLVKYQSRSEPPHLILTNNEYSKLIKDKGAFESNLRESSEEVSKKRDREEFVDYGKVSRQRIEENVGPYHPKDGSHSPHYHHSPPVRQSPPHYSPNSHVDQYEYQRSPNAEVYARPEAYERRGYPAPGPFKQDPRAISRPIYEEAYPPHPQPMTHIPQRNVPQRFEPIGYRSDEYTQETPYTPAPQGFRSFPQYPSQNDDRFAGTQSHYPSAAVYHESRGYHYVRESDMPPASINFNNHLDAPRYRSANPEIKSSPDSHNFGRYPTNGSSFAGQMKTSYGPSDVIFDEMFPPSEYLLSEDGSRRSPGMADN